MPGGDGIAATRAIVEVDPATAPAVLVVTTFDLDECVFGALEAGASGFVLKDSDPDDLIDAVRALADGPGWSTPPSPDGSSPSSADGSAPDHTTTRSTCSPLVRPTSSASWLRAAPTPRSRQSCSSSRAP